ncbi:hypothetical protein AB6A40_007305 [Gnathostoma spinigerum]|uniref:AB hydrolase-1 domain-containing protein n=1 Tax=Gnathostoma spinigerum TaxID=75299 RepID=A0ABD6EMU1_9BILA
MVLEYAWTYIAGPVVYGYFSSRPAYSPNWLERLGDSGLMLLNGLRYICTAISPILILIAHSRSLLTRPHIINFLRYTIGLYAFALSSRTLGRLTNPEYREFVSILSSVKRNKNSDKAMKEQLAEYDYQIFDAPIDFTAAETNRIYVNPTDEAFQSNGLILDLLRDILAYGAAHLFGRRLAYPGSTALVNTVLSSHCIEGRKNLVLHQHARRAVLKTVDGNVIDTMFLDRRERNDDKGKILVINIEGNASMYEAGISTPQSLGYSVLCWNQPGFGESTGEPWPKQTLAAAEAVMQYALKQLGFREEDIVIYCWSIGGFPGTWLAANYPKIKGLILDATFDDLLPLAIDRMPVSCSSIVHYAVRCYLNLPIANQLALYKGPVLLIRRLNDDIVISSKTLMSSDKEKRASNRINFLLKSLLRNRYPGLIDGRESYVDEWLEADALLRSTMEPSQPPPIPNNFSSVTDEERSRIIFYLCSKYFVDYDAGHNDPLNPLLFILPPSF